MRRITSEALIRLTHWRNKLSFNQAAQGIFTTLPLQMVGDEPLFLSMLCHNDLILYLLAIKSLYVRVGHGVVVIINDGSLTPDDRNILQYHIPKVQILELKNIEVGPCPRADFFWERLVKIVQLSSDHYVIQVDADTLVSGEIPEVVQCWRENRSFLLGTGSGQTICPAPETAKMVQGWIRTNGWTQLPVFVEAEASLDKLPVAAQRSYVHASAGFAGFARGGGSLEELEWFSTYMSKLLGPQRWAEYGSEQIASNYILANAPGATVLPFPRYACFEPHLKCGGDAFLHFIGKYRYQDGLYRQRAAEFISRYTQVMAQN